jgi:hypothetical protein
MVFIDFPMASIYLHSQSMVSRFARPTSIAAFLLRRLRRRSAHCLESRRVRITCGLEDLSSFGYIYVYI